MSRNVLIDKNSLSVKGSGSGIASFNLKLLSALPGNYTIAFESVGVKSDRSLSFEVKNHVKQVEIV